ncbi:MAG TPA: ATP-binding protein [Verrucomicrobiae bacterium]|nr:ATP-binding protein [Verrucomicrobiae bacterium]
MDAPTDVLLQHWPGVLFRQAADLRFEFLSPRIADWTGHPPEAFLARPSLFFECVHWRDADVLREHLNPAGSPAGRSARFRFRHFATGRVTHVSEFRRVMFDPAGAAGGWEGFWQDETRLALAERRLESAAWKEALSELTGGFTHDFNNVFGAVHSLSDSFLSQIEPGHPFHEGLALMKRDTRQAGQLVQRLQQLHLTHAGQLAYHDLNAAVTESAELLRRGLSKRVEIVTELAAAQLPIHADAVSLQHVIVALVLNGAEAMSGGGRVVLRTRSLVEPRPPDRFAGTWPKSPSVWLSVQDAGPGFAPPQLAAIFEPGFTTRPASLGIGLGLLHARRFAERHRGAISVEAVPGVGATVHLWLPQSDFTEADGAASDFATRSCSILLAGQPPGLLAETADFLKRHHFRVVMADETTLELLSSPDHDIDALLVRAVPNDIKTPRLVDFIRRHRLPVKVFVQPAGCAVDSLDPGLIAKADATFSEDLAEARLVEKLTKSLSGA